MPVVRLTSVIAAPIERVFDLARSIDLHTRSTARTGEVAIAGVTSGLIGFGETVTWRARHFGIRQTLTSKITAYDRPRHFRDSMLRGAFARIDHDHFFQQEEGSRNTIMTDAFDFDAPLGILGRIAERLVLARYMERFLRERNEMITRIAESESEWQPLLESRPGA